MNTLNWSDREVTSLILDQMNVGFIVAEYPSGKILEYNKASEAILGHPVIQASDVTEYSAYGGFHADGTRIEALDYPMARALMNGEQIYNEEMIYLTPEQGKKIISINASPVNSPEGKRLGAVCIFSDITQKKLSELKEKELNRIAQESMAQVKMLLEESPYAVALFDNDGRYLHLNTKLSKFNGLPIEAHIGKKPSDLFGAAGDKVDEIINEVKASKKPFPDIIIETATPAHPNVIKTYCLQFYPVQLGESFLGVGFFAEDVTEESNEKNRKAEEHKKTFNEKEQITQFVNVLSHDIRSPLSAIRLNAQLILKNLGNNEKLISYSSKITDLTVKVNNFITDILDVNTFRAGERIDLKLSLVSFDSVVRELTDHHASLHGDVFILDLHADAAGNWSLTAIERILENLISNSIKYSEKFSKITLKSWCDETSLYFEINNKGNVIPEEMREEIFLPFKRLKTVNVSSKSYGLGLAIVKGLVDAQRGSIMVESNTSNGTTFKMSLPLNNSTVTA